MPITAAADLQSGPDALPAYLKLLRQRGASTASINQRKHFLRYLLLALDQTREDSVAYRHAVDQVLAKMASDESRPFLVSVAREFFPFWMGDLETVMALAAGDGFALQPILLQSSGSLIQLFEAMDSDGWEDRDIPSLSQYLADTTPPGDEEHVLDLRDRFLRALHFILQHQPVNPATYRAGVNAMLLLMPRAQTQRSFLNLIREYFPYWMDNGPREKEQDASATPR